MPADPPGSRLGALPIPADPPGSRLGALPLGI